MTSLDFGVGVWKTLRTLQASRYWAAMLHPLLIEDNPADVLMVLEAMNSSPIPADVDFACDDEEALMLLQNSYFDFVMTSIFQSSTDTPFSNEIGFRTAPQSLFSVAPMTKWRRKRLWRLAQMSTS